MIKTRTRDINIIKNASFYQRYIMNWSKIYIDLVMSRKHRGNAKNIGYELHHIVPKSLGGDDSDDNLVLLTPREHFLAHLLLVKNSTTTNQKTKMGYALNMMMNTRNNLEAKNSRLYELFRTEYNKNHISKTAKWKDAQSTRQKEVMKDRVHMNFNGKNKFVKSYNVQSKLLLGWSVGWIKTKKMIDADKRKSEITRNTSGTRKINKFLFNDIIDLYNRRPHIDLDSIKANRSKGASRPVIYEREFCKLYASKYSITPNGMYGIITGKIKCPPN